MSLQVWLPLTKDLRQQGLSNISVIGSPASWGNGKLGKCATWNGAVDNVLYNNTTDFNYTNNFSVAFWANPIYTGSTAQYAWTVGRADTGGYGYGFQIISTTTAQFRFGNGSYDVSAPSNEWHHFVMTVGNNKVIIYKDGVQVSSNNLPGTIPTYSDGNGMGLGCFHYSGNIYPYYGSLNDFRIYDHCLSPMEIKELAKGLILHYPLNRQGWGQENLFINSNFSKGTNNWYGVNSSSIQVETKDGKTCGTGTKGTSTNMLGQTCGSYAGSNAIVDITVSAKIYVTETGTFSVGHWITTTQASGWQGMSTSGGVTWGGDTSNGTLQVGWNYITNTWKGAKNQYAGSIVTAFGYTGTTFWITDVKFEFGDKATPWCPNSSDELATTMGLNSTTEYDCSGFGNNGTKWSYDSTGIIDYTSDTPKYQVSTYINSDNNTTNTASGTRYIYGNCELTTPQYLTVAFWCKPIAGYGSNVTQGQFSLTNNTIGDSAGQDYDACPMNHRDSMIDMCTSSGTHKTVSITFTANEWHHYVIVYDGRYGRVYKDGIATGATLDMGSVFSLKDMKGAVIGFSKAGGVWRSNKSYYSDFRIYATALSAEDIKSLYQNSAYIDSSGNVYGAVHGEA